LEGNRLSRRRCRLFNERCRCSFKIGKKVIIDSTHEWIGRQMYLIDIKDVLSL